MSSARAELQGQEISVIMVKYLTIFHNASDWPVTFVCDDKAYVQRKLRRNHNQAKMEQYLEYWSHCKGIKVCNEWVKRHQHKGEQLTGIYDLGHLKLEVGEKLNIFCDHMGGEKTALGISEPDIEVFPAEHWARCIKQAFHRKVVGKFETTSKESITSLKPNWSNRNYEIWTLY